MACTYNHCDVDIWWFINTSSRFCCSSIHIYSFLRFWHVHSRHISFYHDSAAVLIKNGEIIAAAQEERFTRKKHDASFPHHALQYCLKEGGIPASKIDNVVFYEKPFLKFERLLETYLAFAPKGFISFC